MAQGYEDPLRIAARRHDLSGIQIYDPAEKELPNVGLIRATDAETGEEGWIDTSSQRVRETYAAWFKENENYFKQNFNRSGADTVSISNNESYVNALLRFFKQRGR